MQRFISLFMGLLTALLMWSTEVSGRVMNPRENLPEPYATVRLYALTDTVTPLKITAADADGVFILDLEPGNYRLMVSALGAQSATRDFVVGEESVMLGDVALGASDTELGEVTVQGLRPVVRREIDRLSYDVQEDADSRTLDLLEFLRKVPMVSVEADGTIKIKGSTSFKIYKNGRPNSSFSNNASQLFEAIPASSIKRIEVITDPGAREDAEGTMVILNIVTTDDTRITGVTGTAALSTNSRTNFIPNPRLYITGQYDRFIISGYLGNFYSTPSGNRGNSEGHGEYLQSGNRIETRNESDSRSSWTWGGFDASFEPDSLNLITAELNLSSGFSRTDSRSSNRMTASDGTLIYSYDNISEAESPGNQYSVDAGLSYQRTTRRPGESISMTYNISTWRARGAEHSRFENMINLPVGYTGVNMRERMSSSENVLQLDWEHPFNERHTLNTGAKYSYFYNHARANSEYIGMGEDYSNYRHIRQVGAAYADWRGILGKVSLRAGVRYEFSRLEAQYLDGTTPSYHSTFNDICPNASMQWTPNDASTFKVSYNRSIARPGIYYLNPAVYASPTEVRFGNPDLKTVPVDYISGSYSLVNSHLYLEASVGTGFQREDISNYQWVEDNVIYSTYANRQHNYWTDLSAYLQWSITDKTQVQINSSVVYAHRHDPSGTQISHWSSNGSLTVTQQLPWKLRLQGAFYYFTGDLYSLYQYSVASSGGRDYALALQRSFLRDDRFTVRIRANNIFGPMHQHYYVHAVNSDFIGVKRKTWNRQSYIAVQLSYRFGNLNAQVKRTRRNEYQETISGGGSNTGQQGN